jgi:hypothetical protein
VVLCGWNQSPSAAAAALAASIYNVSSITCCHGDVMVTVLLPSSQNYSQVIPGADTANQTMTYKPDIFWTPVRHSIINSFVYCTWRGGGVPFTYDRMNRTLDHDFCNLVISLWHVESWCPSNRMIVNTASNLELCALVYCFWAVFLHTFHHQTHASPAFVFQLLNFNKFVTALIHLTGQFSILTLLITGICQIGCCLNTECSFQYTD